MSVVNCFPVIAGFGTIYQSIVIVGCLFFCQLRRLSVTVKYFAIAQTNAISLKICHWSSKDSQYIFHRWIWNNIEVTVHQSLVNSRFSFLQAQSILLLYPHSFFLLQTKMMLVFALLSLSMSLMSVSLMLSLSLMSVSLMLLLSLFLSSPSNVVVVSALGFSLADEVDVVADGLAAADVLPLPDVLPRVPKHNTVLVSICGGLVTDPARIVAVRASIAPHPGALGGTVSQPNVSSPIVLGNCSLDRCVLVCRRDNSQSQIALIFASRFCIAPAALPFPQDIALGSIRVHCVPTRTGCIA